MTATTTLPTVESYAKKYPDIPKEVILKEDLLRLGLNITKDAMELSKGCREQAYYLFSYNISSHEELADGVSTAAPEDIRFHGGPYGLRPTSVRVVLSAKSPYAIDVVGGKPTICENGTPVAEASFPEKPPYYGKQCEDGTLYEQVIPLLYNHYAFITTFRVCHYWGDQEECKFCDINNHVRELRKLTGDHVTADAIKDPSKVVEVIGEMAREARPEHRLITIIMTGGSILRKVQRGADNATDFNIPYIEAIRERIGNRIPIVMITESQPMDNVRRLRDAGVTVHNANLEVWDERLFKVIAPGKQKYIGYDTWVRRLVEAVDIMGEGNVTPNMVSGVEMAQPWGFDRVDDAVKSAQEGFEYLMSHGIIPHLDTWCVEPGSPLEGHPPVPLDFLIRADIAWYETWRKYNLPPFEGYGPMGSPSTGIPHRWIWGLEIELLEDPARSIPRRECLLTTEIGAQSVIGNVIKDLQYSLRMLVKSPLFSIIAITTLALGIGLNAATFSAIHGLLLRPLGGVASPEELVQVYRQWPGIIYGSNSIPHYQDVRDRSDEVFESTAAWFFSPMSLSADGRSERILGVVASANLLQTYGVVPALGRPFLPGEEDRSPGAHAVTFLGHSFWQARFGGDPGVIGRTIDINGRPFVIVGVAPPAFKGPMAVLDVPLYVPIMMQAEIMPGNNLLESRGNNMMNVVARLRDGKTIDHAQQMMDAMLLQLQEELPDSYKGQRGTTLVYQSESGIHPSFRNAQVGMSSVMMAVVSLLLLIACVNVANLFLARARERRREMGIRMSMGAGRGRILQQLFTESVVFSLLAGLAGVGLAYLVTGILSRVQLPIDGPFDFEVGIDNTVLLFTLAVSIAAGLIFGLAPALQAARSDLVTAVRGESSQTGGRSRVSGGLVVLQMALSIILLISSGLFIRALKSATEIDPGMDAPKNLVMASLDPGLQGLDEPQTRQFYDRLAEELAARPNVTAVGFTNSVPLGFSNSDRGVDIPGYEFAEGERKSLHYSIVTDGYLETMGVDLLAGRTFTRLDNDTGAPVIIINRRFAERFWPDESALGKIVQTAGEDREVIGVVETGKYRSLGEEPTEFMYLPERELFRSGLTLVVRTPTNPQAVLQGVRETVRGLDENMPLFDVRTMEDHMGIALLPARLGGSVLGIFGVLGLLLAAVGIYGVMAYSVAQRQRELGIRVALGADRSTVVQLVLREGLTLAVIGIVLGLAGAAGAAQLVKGMLYNVRAIDPVAFGTVPLMLILVAAMAVYLPARRAARVEPMRVLKVD